MAKNPYNGFTYEDRNASSKLFRTRCAQGIYEWPQKEMCEACLQTEGDIEWHREDYSIVSPAELITICYRCHRVLHMRDRHPGTWNLYRKYVREGYRWYATKGFGTVLKENVNSIILAKAEKVNAPRDWTPLDAVADGSMLRDTHEIRIERMKGVWKDLGKVRPDDVLPDQPTLL